MLPTQLCQRKWKENNKTSYAAQLLKQVLPIYTTEIVVYSSFIDYSFVVSPGVTFKCQVRMYSNYQRQQQHLQENSRVAMQLFVDRSQQTHNKFKNYLLGFHQN